MRLSVLSMAFFGLLCSVAKPAGAEDTIPDTAQISQQDLTTDHIQIQSIVMDRVTAIVGEQVLTANDIRLEAALAPIDPSPVPILRTTASDPLQSIIDLAIIRQKAGNIALYQPSASDLRVRLNQLRASADDYDAILTQLAINESRIESILFARMVAENFVYRQVVLASKGQSEDQTALNSRYRAWITTLRSETPIRVVSPLESLDL